MQAQAQMLGAQGGQQAEQGRPVQCGPGSAPTNPQGLAAAGESQILPLFKVSPKRLAMRIALAYALVGGAWILLSDHVLSMLPIGDLNSITHLQTCKGWFFILLTAGVLYGLVSASLRAACRAEEQMLAAKNAAEAANRTKDRFLASLSHELRTPLTPVLAAVSAAEQGRSEISQADLQLIRHNIEVEARLIDNLLDLTRLGCGKIPFTPQTVDAHALLQAALECCRGEIRDKDLQIIMSLQAQCHHVAADPPRLQQVFWNLIQNAVKFTSPGGAIRIRSWGEGEDGSDGATKRRSDEGKEEERHEGTEARRHEGGRSDSALRTQHSELGSSGTRLFIEIADTGIGIEPDVLPRVFNAFEQVSRPEAQKFGGLGMGLALSRAIMELHGGRLIVSSEGRGRGAAFTVDLETTEPPPAADKPIPATPDLERSPARPLSILLVEDNADTARILARLLRSNEHQVRIADRVETAAKIAAEEEFDLLISDIGLPDGTGVDLLRQIQRTRPMRAIAISGFGMEEDVRRSLAAGFLEHLIKPIDFGHLEQAIARAADFDQPGEDRRPGKEHK